MEGTCAWDQMHVELIEGELINKIGKRRPHVISYSVLVAWLITVFGAEYVNSEAPIDVQPEENPTSEPEPDLIVLTRPAKEIREGNPKPNDLRLVVEISDSTVGFDLTAKVGLYARAGIIEYWVLDIPGRKLIVHRDPANGTYRSTCAYSERETVRPLAAPDSEFRVADAFPE